MNDPTVFPYPIPEEAAKPYWAACNHGELQMQRCCDCNCYRWLPGELCAQCGSAALQWTPLSGRGRITTWTVITHPVHPAAIARVPYIVAEVELEEQQGLRMISNLIGLKPEVVEFDLPVRVIFEDHPSGQKLPVFCPLVPT